MNVIPENLMLPLRTVTGSGTALRLGESCADFGPHGLVVHGRSLEQSGSIKAILDAAPRELSIDTFCYTGGEPTLDTVEELREKIRDLRPDWVAAVGGGSVMDCAKAAAGLSDADGPVAAYHDGEPIPPATLPFAAVPTTAGTGSEATVVSVLTNAEKNVKKSIRHETFMPRLVILDPDLLVQCPPPVIASAGIDALVQAIESYTSRNATWFTEQPALKAVDLINSSLEPVFSGDTGKAEGLLTGSYLAGLALSNSRLGLVHGLAHPLGARFHQPHGLVCAVCMGPVLGFNREAIKEKYAVIGNIMGVDPCERFAQLIDTFNMVSPFKGKTLPDRDETIKEVLSSGSTKANPRVVTAEDAGLILDKLFS